jgi:hypothetical protein
MADPFEGSDKPIIPSVKFPPLIDSKNGPYAFYILLDARIRMQTQ